MCSFWGGVGGRGGEFLFFRSGSKFSEFLFNLSMFYHLSNLAIGLFSAVYEFNLNSRYLKFGHVS